VLISVAVPVPFLDLLTYNVPDSVAVPPIGARVRVPVGARTLTGCVVRHDAPVEDGTVVKDIGEAVDREPLLPPSVVELCRWVADYYVAGIGDALAAAMPPGVRGKASAFRNQRIATLSVMGSDPEAERGAPDPHRGARRPADVGASRARRHSGGSGRTRAARVGRLARGAR